MSDTTVTGKSAAAAEPDTGQGRSPNYPSMTVSRALGIAEKVYEAERRFAVPVIAVCKHAGYSGTQSGPAKRALSALKKYGLFDEKEGTYSMTEAAKRYVLSPNDLTLRARIAADMAKKYDIVVQTIEQFPAGLPNDEILKSFFIIEKKFTDGGATEFIGIIRDLVNTANVEQPAQPSANPAHLAPPPKADEPPAAVQASPRIPISEVGSVNVFSLGGATVELRSSIPLDEMTNRQLDRLIRFINVLKNDNPSS